MMGDVKTQPAAAGRADSGSHESHTPAFDPSHEIYCPHCAYDLRGLATDKCPECGRQFDATALKRSQIPWSYRDTIGHIRAYWRTVFRVMFRHPTFSREIARPVDYKDARKFQGLTILLAWIGLVMATLAIAILHGYGWLKDLGLDSEIIEMAIEAIWPIAVVHVQFVAYLIVATGVQSYWFHPKRLPAARQNRAVALSYYCCAPLALLPLIAMMGASGLIAVAAAEDQSIISEILGSTDLPLALVVVVCGGAGIVVLGSWYLQPMSLMYHTHTRGLLGIVAMGIINPLISLAMAAIIFAGLPFIGLYLYLFFVTLW